MWGGGCRGGVGPPRKAFNFKRRVFPSFERVFNQSTEFFPSPNFFPQQSFTCFLTTTAGGARGGGGVALFENFEVFNSKKRVFTPFERVLTFLHFRHFPLFYVFLDFPRFLRSLCFFFCFKQFWRENCYLPKSEMVCKVLPNPISSAKIPLIPFSNREIIQFNPRT